MRVGIKAKLINYNFYMRRHELGLSQIELARRAQTTVDFISAIESLRQPKAKRLWILKDRLNRLAIEMESDFDFLFPKDYLDAIQAKMLPNRITPVIWQREISIDALSLTDDRLLLDSPEDLLIESSQDDELNNSIRQTLDSMPERHREIIERRFGIGKEDGAHETLRQIGESLGISTDRVRQIEADALRSLRHPRRSKYLTEYLR